MDDLKILDIEHALNDMGDDREIYEVVLESFLEDTPSTLSNIKKAFIKNDFETGIRYSHSLKSSSRTMGAIKMSNIASKIEHDAEGMEKTQIEEYVNKLFIAFTELKENFKIKGFNVPE